MSLASSKADLEVKLDDCIMNALDSLLRNCPASDEFTAIYQEKMFIKPNTKAFIYVTHYLFTVLDEKEFKKRFYWPIKCKTDESHFRTSTVEYINHLISQGKLKMDKIKAMHVVIPGGIKFMKFLLKAIVLVVNETLARKKLTNFVAKERIGEYICKDLLEKSEVLTSLGVELKKIVAEDIAAIKKKTEMIDMAVGKVFADVTEVEEIDRKEFFDTWAQVNSEKYCAMQKEQHKMRQVIVRFGSICKMGQNLMQPQDFGPSKYNSEEIKDAIQIIKSKIGYLDDESETTLTTYAYTNMPEVIKLIKFSIDHVINLIIQCPLRDFRDMKADATMIKELYGKTMTVSTDVKSLLKRVLNNPSSENKTEETMENVIRDPQLLQGFFGTPPISINTKECDDLSVLHMPFGRIGTRDITRMNMSQSRILQLSQKELMFSPKLERSMLAPPIQPVLQMKPPRSTKRYFQINAASLFAPKETPRTNISRLDSYSMVMPGSGNVLSSTVLDHTIRNQTPPSIGLNNFGNKRKSTECMSPLNATQVPKNTQGTNTPLSSTHHLLSPHTKKLSISKVLSPKIQLNDETIKSPIILRKSKSPLPPKSSSPSSRIALRAGRPLSLSTNSDSNRTLTEGKDESPNTLDIFSKFKNMNLNEEKENLCDISETMLVDDSM